MDLQIKNNTGKVVGSVEVSDQVWSAGSNDALLHQVVVAQQANQRRGTQDTQTRAEVSFSGRKLRPQKGSGASRQGSRRSSIRIGGGVAHGPHPRSHRQRIPKKMRRQALRVALSDKLRDQSVTVIDSLKLEGPQSSVITSLVDTFKLQGRTLIVTASTDHNVVKSTNNLPDVEVQAASLMNPLETVRVPNLIVTKDALQTIDSIWSDRGKE